jgi:hypothetical protein
VTLASGGHYSGSIQSGVSLGAIGWVLNDLKEKGYIQEQGKKHVKSLAKPIDLLDRWAEVYPEKLGFWGLSVLKRHKPLQPISVVAFRGVLT